MNYRQLKEATVVCLVAVGLLIFWLGLALWV